MATRLFAPSASLTLPCTTVAASLDLANVGTQCMISNVTSNEACVLFTTSSTINVVVPVSTSSTVAGTSIPGNQTLGFDISGTTWLSAICPVATATTNLRVSQGEGGMS